MTANHSHCYFGGFLLRFEKTSLLNSRGLCAGSPKSFGIQRNNAKRFCAKANFGWFVSVFDHLCTFPFVKIAFTDFTIFFYFSFLFTQCSLWFFKGKRWNFLPCTLQGSKTDRHVDKDKIMSRAWPFWATTPGNKCAFSSATNGSKNCDSSVHFSSGINSALQGSFVRAKKKRAWFGGMPKVFEDSQFWICCPQKETERFRYVMCAV